jgi:hypothetical protein
MERGSESRSLRPRRLRLPGCLPNRGRQHQKVPATVVTYGLDEEGRRAAHDPVRALIGVNRRSASMFMDTRAPVPRDARFSLRSGIAIYPGVVGGKNDSEHYCRFTDRAVARRLRHRPRRTLSWLARRREVPPLLAGVPPLDLLPAGIRSTALGAVSRLSQVDPELHAQVMCSTSDFLPLSAGRPQHAAAWSAHRAKRV